jgi:phospholipid/cholesterol/gamma-HCH transport system substrate-binding protein
MNNTLKQADAMMVNLEKASKPLADRGESMTKNLDESIGRLNRVLASVEDLFRDFGKGKGTLPQLLNDPQLYNNLNDAALAIVRMMPQLDRILKDVETFADKIARHPEALGVGGAIRPGSGLK